MRSTFSSRSGFSGKVYSEEEKNKIEGIYSIDISKESIPVLTVIIKTFEFQVTLISLWKLYLSEELIKNHVRLYNYLL